MLKQLRRPAMLSECLVRWMIRRDRPEVLDIEAASCLVPWSDEDLGRVMRGRSAIGLVVELHGRIVAFTVFELGTRRLTVHKLAVAPDHRAAVREKPARIAIDAGFRQGPLPAHGEILAHIGGEMRADTRTASRRLDELSRRTCLREWSPALFYRRQDGSRPVYGSFKLCGADRRHLRLH